MAVTATLFSTSGKSQGDKPLSAAVFAAPVNEALIAQALKVYSTRQRQNTKKVKTRAEVSFTGQKMWRQKGTGRARHGSRRAPIFVGGGVAHGPTGLERTNLKLSQKMRRAAINSALTLHAQKKSISLVEDFSTDKKPLKTKSMLSLLQTITQAKDALPKILLILDQPNPNIIHSVANLTKVSPTQAKRLNLYEVMNSQKLIITVSALKQIESQI